MPGRGWPQPRTPSALRKEGERKPNRSSWVCLRCSGDLFFDFLKALLGFYFFYIGFLSKSKLWVKPSWEMLAKAATTYHFGVAYGWVQNQLVGVWIKTWFWAMVKGVMGSKPVGYFFGDGYGWVKTNLSYLFGDGSHLLWPILKDFCCWEFDIE